MSKLTESLAAMQGFLTKGGTLTEECKDSPKALLMQATDIVIGKSQKVDGLLIQALTLIPSDKIDEVVSIMGQVCNEYKRLREGVTYDDEAGNSKEPEAEQG